MPGHQRRPLTVVVLVSPATVMVTDSRAAAAAAEACLGLRWEVHTEGRGRTRVLGSGCGANTDPVSPDHLNSVSLHVVTWESDVQVPFKRLLGRRRVCLMPLLWLKPHSLAGSRGPLLISPGREGLALSMGSSGGIGSFPENGVTRGLLRSKVIGRER